MIKISVIVPVYNTEKYLEKCLNSIMNQSFKDIEIIIINDCSTDNSLKVIKKFLSLDQRIILIDKEKNEGLSAARNSGIEKAKGEYILHIDGDDWIEKRYIEDIYMCAKKNRADIVITDFYEDFENKKVIYIHEKIENKNNEVDKEEALKNIFLMEACNAVWNKLIKREVYKKNKINHPEEIMLGEDLAVIPKLLYFSKKIIKINKAYYHYIQNPLSITKQYNSQKIFEIYKSLKINQNFFENKEIKLPINLLKVNHLSIWLFNVKYDLKNKEYIDILEDYIKLIKKLSIKDLKSIKNKKIKIIVIILKALNNKIVFILLWKISLLKKYCDTFYKKLLY